MQLKLVLKHCFQRNFQRLFDRNLLFISENVDIIRNTKDALVSIELTDLCVVCNIVFQFNLRSQWKQQHIRLLGMVPPDVMQCKSLSLSLITHEILVLLTDCYSEAQASVSGSSNKLGY